ncbi:hypothetical protein CAPTEDRAFT_213561 [Capitella teleta]|uniref:DUF4806 domain-containing protein n=1 Tax=Capitella teleta TaxID=283909 RepID=R7VCJ6_CAPTE|nr:hypothetical protein CAPTEDRAFT_213561 [Capitella teleta]|eukprot:ELU16349.1 hypothetical protein CAPTEDRAFT_213561 [Capitella teleta]
MADYIVRFHPKDIPGAVLPNSDVDSNTKSELKAFCYWPKASEVEKGIRTQADPGVDWSLLSIREFQGARTSDLKRARRLCTKAEQLSSFESEQENGKRQCTAPAYLNDYETDADEEEAEAEAEADLRYLLYNPLALDLYPKSSRWISRCPQHNQLKKGRDFATRRNGRPAPATTNCEEIEESSFIKEHQKSDSRPEGSGHGYLAGGGNAETAEVVEDFLPQPAATLPAMRDLEATLKLDIKLRRQLIAYLAFLGGTTAADAMRRMMKKLASAAVWSQFSLFGKKKKLSLAGEAEKITSILIKAYQSRNRSAQEAIETTLVECLKAAPRWPGGPRSAKGRASMEEDASFHRPALVLSEDEDE